MRQIDSTGFNETLIKLIKRLQFLVNSIPPESVKYLPANVVDTLMTVKNYDFIRFDDMAMVNSIDMYKLNSMSRFLHSNMLVTTSDTVTIELGSSTSALIYGDTIALPNSFDGRMGYANWIVEHSTFQTPFSESVRRFKKNKQVHSNRANLYMNEHNITVDLFLDHSKKNTPSFVTKAGDKYTAQVFYMLWRYRYA